MFCAFPDVYNNNDRKVSFAITYLCGAALDFFEFYLIDLMDTLDWWWDYLTFLCILHTNSSLFDPEREAEEAIDNLTIKNT